MRLVKTINDGADFVRWYEQECKTEDDVYLLSTLEEAFDAGTFDYRDKMNEEDVKDILRYELTEYRNEDSERYPDMRDFVIDYECELEDCVDDFDAEKFLTDVRYRTECLNEINIIFFIDSNGNIIIER